MDKLVYLTYPVLLVIFLWGAKFSKKGEWNGEFMSLSQVKALQGFAAICIMLHHIGQATCAPWLPGFRIIPGLELFVPIGYFFVGIFLFCSGYGLYKSYRQKENYLQGFFHKRMLTVILSYYTTGWIFLVVRFLMREKMSPLQIVYYITGIQLSNPNAWYVIALPYLYLGFYLMFRFCKKERTALLGVCLWVFAYTLVGTIVDHNDFWMRGEWWYNSVHFFPLGLFFAKYEKKVVEGLKKHYAVKLIAGVICIYVLFGFSEFAQGVFSYYGENFHANFKVLRRWACLLSQIGASVSFVFTVFLLLMKVKIGNRFLTFMGNITLEFYLIHGLFLSLFSYSFLDRAKSLYYIQNVALLILVVFLPSIPAALLLQKLHRRLVQLLTPKRKE